jgi:FeS assembly protein IscX
MHQWVTELSEFKGDPKASNEKILESIQMAWYEEFKAAHE